MNTRTLRLFKSCLWTTFLCLAIPAAPAQDLDFTAVRRQGKNLPMHCTLSRHCG